MTIDQAIEEFEKATNKYVGLWGLEFYMYGQYGIADHKKYENDLNEHPWRFHLKAAFSLSSSNGGITYRTDDPIEGINKLTKYIVDHPHEIWNWNVNKRLDLGTPNDPR